MSTEPIPTRTYGEGGEPVVVLHGGPGAPGCVAALARRLGQDVAVLEPWQRRSGSEPLSVQRHVDDLRVVAPEHAMLVGASWGAMLALSYASLHPTRTRAVVLIGCGTYDEASRALYREAMQAALGADGRARATELRAALERADDAEVRDALWGELGALLSSAQDVDALPSEDVEFDARGHDETWHDVLRLQAEGIEPQRFAAIACPVLMLHGAQDPHPGPATRDVLRQVIPQLEYVEFARCGHEPWRERHARDAFFGTLLARINAWR